MWDKRIPNRLVYFVLFLFQCPIGAFSRLKFFNIQWQRSCLAPSDGLPFQRVCFCFKSEAKKQWVWVDLRPLGPSGGRGYVL